MKLKLLMSFSTLFQAVEIAQDADMIILAVGASWNSDGENGDRASLGLSVNQSMCFVAS